LIQRYGGVPVRKELCKGWGRLGENYGGLQGITGSCRGLQGVAEDYRELQRIAEDCRELQGVAGNCRELQGITESYREPQRITTTVTAATFREFSRRTL